MIKIKNVKMIDVNDWDKLVSETYGRPYNFQQQEGCRERGIFNISIPSKYAEEEEEDMNNDIPEIEVNSEDFMGIKFEKWLERDPKASVNGKDDYMIKIFWNRNFYPNIYTVANDLYKKGLIEAGEYSIKIDW